MARFDYSAESAAGEVVRGSIRAATPADARTLLLDRELIVDDVKQRAPKVRVRRSRVSRTELMHLSRQLAAFLTAGIPILEALELLSEESANVRLRDVLGEVASAVGAGETFSAAIEAHPKVFPLSYRTMLRSAELTGQLDVVLEQLSEYLERDVDAQQKMRGALAYPVIVASLSIVTVLIITVFVLPRFKLFFASLHRQLPLPTRLLISITDVLHLLWPFLLLGFVVAAVAIAAAIRTDRGRLVRDTMLLHTPVIGEIVRFSVVERFCRILATMVVAGVPMPEAMTVASVGVGNAVYEAALLKARERMLEGQGIARPLAASRVFPAAATQMLRVGESTGSLHEQLVSAARFYERELGYKIKRFTTLVEPTVIVIMGLVVGFVAVAVISAMYGVFKGGGI
ncbi:MAG: type pilus assembly protein PilC [Frankiaceae bacterium]|nr:type pilus assembly protein PilC [Frankiaceae bacterium]